MRRAALALALAGAALAACGSGYARTAAPAASATATATPRFLIPASATPLPHTVAENPLAIHPPVVTEASIALTVTGATRFDGALGDAAECIVTAEPAATILVEGTAGSLALSFLIIDPTDGAAPVALGGSAGARVDALEVNVNGRIYRGGTGEATLSDGGNTGSLTARGLVAGASGAADITMAVQWRCG
jgi:hypothetical protein